MNHPRLKQMMATKEGKSPEVRRNFQLGGFWRGIKRKFVWNRPDIFRSFRKPDKFRKSEDLDDGVRIEVIPDASTNKKAPISHNGPIRGTRIKKRKFVWGEPP